MTLMLTACLLQLVLYCSSQTTGLVVQSDPAVSGEGFIPTELERTVSLTCLSEGGSLPGDELIWLRNGAAVNLMEGNRQGRSSLCVTPVTREDQAAIFTCHLKSDASVNASVTLEVTYAPLHSEMEEVSVKEEAELLLQCEVQANPPVSVSWQQEGAPVDPLKGGFIVTNDGYSTRLSVGRVERGVHQGVYRCVTTSPVYGASSKSFQVTVTDKTLQFPLMPMIAGLVVVCCTTLLAIVSRWKKIIQCCK